MNIRNLGRKESVGIKFKKGIYAKLCLKPWFESDWYFGNILVILLSQDGFESTVVQKCNFFLQITGGTEVQLFSTKHTFFSNIATFFYKAQLFFPILQLFSTKRNFFFQYCNFSLQSTNFFSNIATFSTKHYFFCQYCDFFIQITTFFYNITAFFYKLQLFFLQTALFFL